MVQFYSFLFLVHCSLYLVRNGSWQELHFRFLISGCIFFFVVVTVRESAPGGLACLGVIPTLRGGIWCAATGKQARSNWEIACIIFLPTLLIPFSFLLCYPLGTVHLEEGLIDHTVS
jgi:hypothetical protein